MGFEPDCGWVPHATAGDRYGARSDRETTVGPTNCCSEVRLADEATTQGGGFRLVADMGRVAEPPLSLSARAKRMPDPRRGGARRDRSFVKREILRPADREAGAGASENTLVGDVIFGLVLDS
jgi:hypothetical protein